MAYSTSLSHRLLLWNVFVLCFIGYIVCETSVPLNHAAAKDSTFSLNCSTDLKGLITWSYRGFDRVGKVAKISDGRGIHSAHRDKFSLDTYIAGSSRLIIGASNRTAGKYTCEVDTKPPTMIGTAEVIVLDPQPTCSKEEIPGFVKAYCSIRYIGNWWPKVEWYSTSGSLKTNETRTNKTATSSVTVPFNKSDPGVSFTLTCTPKFQIEDIPPETIAKNVPVFPVSCTFAIGSSEKKPSVQSTASSFVFCAVQYWPTLYLCLYSASLSFLELLY